MLAVAWFLALLLMCGAALAARHDPRDEWELCHSQARAFGLWSCTRGHTHNE